MTWLFPALFVALWSTGFIGAKLGLPYSEPFVFLELRFLCVLAILLPLCWLTRAPWPSSRRTMQMAISGGLLQAGYLGGVFASLHHGMPAGVSALITGMQPVLTAVLGTWLLRETVKPRQWVGLGLGLIGVVLVVGDRLRVDGLGAGAIAQVIHQISRQMAGSRPMAAHFSSPPIAAGLLGGFAIMYATGMLVG